jgi:hypothetical protein
VRMIRTTKKIIGKKFEIRNPKFETITNYGMTNDQSRFET